MSPLGHPPICRLLLATLSLPLCVFLVIIFLKLIPLPLLPVTLETMTTTGTTSTALPLTATTIVSPVELPLDLNSVGLLLLLDKDFKVLLKLPQRLQLLVDIC